MLQKTRTTLLGILLTLLIGIALHSTANGQTPVSVSGSPTTAPASDLATCEQRLDKTLDALEKAEKALSFAIAENASRKALDDLKNQFIAVKDMIITEQQKLITLLQSQKKGNSFKDRLLTILKVAEKAATIALGIIIGRGI